MATYFPNPGFVGTDQFTFAAYDGSKNSDLATGTVSVAQGPFSIGAVAHVPPTYPAAWPVAFAVVPTVTNNAAPVTFDWNFGDGSAHSTNQYAAHAYALARHLQLECDLDRVHRLHHRQRQHRHRQPRAASALRAPAAR